MSHYGRLVALLNVLWLSLTPLSPCIAQWSSYHERQLGRIVDRFGESVDMFERGMSIFVGFDDFGRYWLGYQRGNADGNYRRATHLLLSWPAIAKEVEATELQLRGLREWYYAPKEHAIDPVASDFLSDFLLPHQTRRLDEISLQLHLDQFGLLRCLLSPPLAQRLELSQAQRHNLEAKAIQLQDEIYQEMLDIREWVRRELEKELTADQRATLRRMQGRPLQDLNHPPPRLWYLLELGEPAPANRPEEILIRGTR